MDSPIFVSCPVCGALGKVGFPCEFCGMTIPQPQNLSIQKATNRAIVDRQSVLAEEFAKKVSKYQKICPWVNNLAIVSIGELHGAINRNGDLVFPLTHSRILILDHYCILDRDVYSMENSTLYKDVLGDVDSEYIKVVDGLENQFIALETRGVNPDREQLFVSILLYDKASRQRVYKSIHMRYYRGDFRGQKELPVIKVLPSYNAYLCPLNTKGATTLFFPDGSPYLSFKDKYCLVFDSMGREYNCNYYYLDCSDNGILRLINGKNENIEAELASGEDVVSLIKYKDEEMRAQMKQKSAEKRPNKSGCASSAILIFTIGIGAVWEVVEIIRNLLV